MFGTGLEPACPRGGRFIDQLDGALAIWDADHASSPSPQIASAFFLRTSKAAASARAFSFRFRSRSNALMRFFSSFVAWLRRAELARSQSLACSQAVRRARRTYMAKTHSFAVTRPG